MASKNKLLGSGKVEVEDVQESKKIIPSVHAPAWRYNKEHPEGVVFKTDAELDKADISGWVDHPGKVRLLPGHEKLFEEEK